MSILSSFADWFAELHSQKKRTLTSLLGVAWGTFGVVGILAFGDGLESVMEERARGLGRGLVLAWRSRTTLPFEGYASGRVVTFTDDDVLRLEHAIPEIDAISPEYVTRAALQRDTRLFQATVAGVYPAYGPLRSMHVAEGGRFVNGRDISESRRVMFIGTDVKAHLFGDAEAVGQTIVLANTPFTVVGVMRPKLQDSDYEGEDTTRICIPATTYRQVFGDTFPDLFLFAAKERKQTARALDAVYAALGRRAGFDPKDRDALTVWDTTESDIIREQAFLAMDTMVVLACVLTLLVSGVGVGNLMFLLVRRRTREFGIRMALGARPKWILREVLCQALVLVALGGAVGFAFAWLLTAAIRATPLVDSIGSPTISIELASLTIFLLALVGAAAGWFPARRAARLDPVRALSE